MLCIRSEPDIHTGLAQKIINNQTKAGRMRKQHFLWAASRILTLWW